jgi:hypothetical protein
MEPEQGSKLAEPDDSLGQASDLAAQERAPEQGTENAHQDQAGKGIDFQDVDVEQLDVEHGVFSGFGRVVVRRTGRVAWLL